MFQLVFECAKGVDNCTPEAAVCFLLIFLLGDDLANPTQRLSNLQLAPMEQQLFTEAVDLVAKIIHASYAPNSANEFVSGNVHIIKDFIQTLCTLKGAAPKKQPNAPLKWASHTIHDWILREGNYVNSMLNKQSETPSGVRIDTEEMSKVWDSLVNIAMSIPKQTLY